jgi:hypothetical protein
VAGGDPLATSAAGADNGVMNVPASSSRGFSPVLVLIAAGALGGCPQVGVVDGGNTPDAGPPPDVITAADIGGPCTYDPRSGENPSNDCPLGLTCLMVSLDGRVDPAGMVLPQFEDIFSVDLPGGLTEGYCTIVREARLEDGCPTGTIRKFIRSRFVESGFVEVCIRPCTASAECGGGRVCDARFLDVQVGGQLAGVCTRPCAFDFPDCALNGVTEVALQQGQQPFFSAVVDAASGFGGRTCERSTGTCVATPTRGVGDKGAPCATSADCGGLAVCLRDDQFPTDRNDGPAGICVTRCLVTQNGTEGCAPGSVCQPGLLFGFENDAITGGAMMLRDPITGGFGLRNGVCFTDCSLGPDSCPDPTTKCDAVNGAIMGAPTIDESMCVPGEVALQQQ